MANIELKRSNIDIVIAPFVPDAASANMSISTSWAPVDRADVGLQSASMEETIEAGHPLAGNFAAIRDGAVTFLENRFGDRGQSLVTSPVSSLTISWAFDHPEDTLNTGVNLRAIGIWKPAGYSDVVRPQVEVINQYVLGGGLIDDFAAISAYVLTTAQARYPQHTISEPTP